MRLASVFLLLTLCIQSSGCALIDEATLHPKSRAVNTGWNEARNNSILLNIARSRLEEPVNFVAFSKYTGTAGHTAGISFSTSVPPGPTGATSSYGPFTLGGSTGNSIELADLDTSEFYGSMSTAISKEELDTLLRANGVDREVLFYITIEQFRITLASGAIYNVVNDPRDDSWTIDSGNIREQLSDHCLALSANEDIYARINPSRLSPPFGSPVWTSPQHLNDCKFQKFRLLVHLALRNGLRLEPVEIPNPAARQGVKDAPKLIPASQFCYDAGLAKDFNVLNHESDPGTCGKKRPENLGNFEFAGSSGEIVRITRIEPVVRSPIGIFRYLGRLLDPRIGQRVRMASRTPGMQGVPLLEVIGDGNDCFAGASHGNRYYCVPLEGAIPTKATFGVLATLIALHTKRSDLPPPSTLLIAP